MPVLPSIDMLAFLLNFFVFAAESGAAGGDGALGWWFKNVDPYLNYPGFEAWRFFNLALFALIMYYILRKPLSEAFKAKREAIRAELIKAEEEKQAALAELSEIETKLARVDSETRDLLKRAELDAANEKQRILDQTEDAVQRMRSQAESEIVRSGKLAQLELRRFSAEESVRLAEEKIRAAMNEETDARLVKSATQSIGGLS